MIFPLLGLCVPGSHGRRGLETTQTASPAATLPLGVSALVPITRLQGSSQHDGSMSGLVGVHPLPIVPYKWTAVHP